MQKSGVVEHKNMPNLNGLLNSAYKHILLIINILTLIGIYTYVNSANAATVIEGLPGVIVSTGGGDGEGDIDEDDDDTSHEDPDEGGGGAGCNGHCVNCETTDWQVATTGIEYRGTEANCNTTTCKCTRKSAIRCAANYWGTPNEDGETGCSPCPENGKSAPDSVNITSCYLPAGSAFKDNSGNWIYTANCYYK